MQIEVLCGDGLRQEDAYGVTREHKIFHFQRSAMTRPVRRAGDRLAET